MPVQCPNCRTLNRDTAAFCDNCGAPLTAGRQATPQPPPSVVTRPSTLPEEAIRSSAGATPLARQPAGYEPRQAPMSLPSAKRGPPLGAWLGYLAILLVASLALFLFALWTRIITSGGTLRDYLTIYAVLFVISVGFFCRRQRRQDVLGLVTQLRQSTPVPSPTGRPPPQEWQLLLQRTDRNWRPLVDKQGFLQPVIEVTFLPQAVHGSAIEEGSHVAVRGKPRHGSLRARAIWNLSAAGATPADAERSWGRVTDLQPPSQIQDPRSPDGRLLEVRSFRLQPTTSTFELLRDARGELLPAIPVEIRARVITGALQEGDRVELRGRLVRGMLYPREVYNHSAGGAPLVITGWVGLGY